MIRRGGLVASGAMNVRILLAGKGTGWLACLVTVSFLLGCVAPASVNWDQRIGTYTWDEAVTEFGPPTRVTDETGGVKAAEWIRPRMQVEPVAPPPPTYERGEPVDPAQSYGTTAPDKILKLSFTPDGKLMDWKRNY